MSLKEKLKKPLNVVILLLIGPIIVFSITKIFKALIALLIVGVIIFVIWSFLRSRGKKDER